jgi:glycosyltransferase involved in cell wall biosynthesis
VKILHVYKDYYPVLGGIENHLRSLAEGLAQRGHEVTVLVCHPHNKTEVETLNGVRVIRAARLGTVASTPLSLQFAQILAHEQPDLTHLQFPYPIGEVSHWLSQRPTPTVITYNSDVVRQQVIATVYRPLMRWGLRRAEALLATSPNYVVSSPELVRLAAKCLVVPIGIDVDRFSTPTRTHPYSTPTLLFVGRHRYYKGLGDLLKAMPAINGNLVVAGDGPLRAHWQALVTELNLTDKVKFIGTVSDADLPALYRSADVFILPASARSEAYGIVLVEAMAAGLPCITTELGTGTSYVVQHEVTGLVVPARTPSALADAANRLLADPSLRQRLGQAAQQRAAQEFRQETMVDRIERVYEWVTDGRSNN